MTPEEILKVEKDIVLTLKTIYDPEIPVNIYDLGLIYEIDYTPVRPRMGQKHDVRRGAARTQPAVRP